MRKSILRRIFGGSTALMMCAGILASCSSDGSGGAADISKELTVTKVLTDSTTGKEDDYNYELWKDKGDTTMNLTGGGTFSCEWKNINNALFRKGRKFDSTKTYQEFGNMSLDFGIDYQPDGNSYMCVYGWTKDPLVEYYIVESWGSWRPPGAAKSLGTVKVDGGEYDIYKTTRYQQPSIEGTKTFDQYWSVRKQKPDADGTRFEGTISITKHFDAWAAAGLELGKMYEVALTIEGYQSKGKATVYKNDLKIEGEYQKSNDYEIGAVTTTAKKGDASAASYFSDDFDSGEGGWRGRGSASVKLSKDEHKNGSGSLFVSGRTDTWEGAETDLDPDIYKPGSTYGFEVSAMHKVGSDISFKLTLQYNKDGEPHYDEVSSCKAKSGEWVTLSNDAFTIPEGAENTVLYVESPDSLADFYIDDASAKGDSAEAQKKTDPTEKHESVAVTPVVDISWIDPSKPMVAISFDDGASATKKTDPAYRIIDAVADSGFHATFFYVGSWIKTAEQVRYAYEKGMEIANHTMTHPYLSKKSEEQIRSEYEKAHEKLKGIIGVEPSKVLRLPYLDSNQKVKETLYDVALIKCSVDTKDWDKATKEQIVETIKKAKENGTLKNAIVLCHENYEATAEAMEEVIPWLKSEGWQVVTVSELFAANGKTMQGGTVYSRVS